MSRGANTCGAIARIPPGGVAAIVDGTEVLKFCKTVGLLMVAIVPVATAEATTCAPVCIIAFVESNLLTSEPAVLVTLTAGDVKTVVWLPPLCEVLACIGGLTSVTVGTLFTED